MYRIEWTEITGGVPQGLVLGLTLFTIFFNDLDDDITSDMVKLADDLKLIGRKGSEDDVSRQRMETQQAYRPRRTSRAHLAYSPCFTSHGV